VTPRVAAAAFAAFAACAAHAQIGGAPTPDPAVVLNQAKSASGGAAWDALRTQTDGPFSLPADRAAWER